MAAGRVQCLLIATRDGEVVHERFYDAFSEAEKSEIRAAFDDTAEVDALAENQELVGRCRNGRVVAIPSGELVFFGLGTGEYNELAVSEVLRTLISVYKEILKVPTLSDAVLFQNYAQTILVVDEVCKEGLVEYLDKGSILKALAFKVPVFTDDKNKSSLMSRFSSKDVTTK